MIQMSNKQLFISTSLDKTFDKFYADVIIPGLCQWGIDGISFDEQDRLFR
jgi:hypothetical protein